MRLPLSPVPRAFTLTEMLVVVAIAALLIALVMPALQNVLADAAQAKCAGNLRQLGVAAAAYSGDHDGWIVPWRLSKASNDYWVGLLSPYLGYNYARPGGWPDDAFSVFMCPVRKADKKGATEDVLSLTQVKAKFRYGINIYIAENEPDGASMTGSTYRKMKAGQVRADKTYLMMDHFGADQAVYTSMANGTLTWPHRGRINVLYVDGHTESLDQARMGYLSQNPYHVFWRGYDWGKGGYGEE